LLHSALGRQCSAFTVIAIHNLLREHLGLQVIKLPFVLLNLLVKSGLLLLLELLPDIHAPGLGLALQLVSHEGYNSFQVVELVLHKNFFFLSLRHRFIRIHQWDEVTLPCFWRLRLEQLLLT